MMVQAARFIHSEFDHLFGARGQTTYTQDNAISPPNNKFNGAANLVQFNTEVTQYFRSDTLAFAHQTKQQVFGADVVVLKALGLFLSKTQDLPGPLGELVKPISVQWLLPIFRLYRLGQLCFVIRHSVSKLKFPQIALCRRCRANPVRVLSNHY